MIGYPTGRRRLSRGSIGPPYRHVERYSTLSVVGLGGSERDVSVDIIDELTVSEISDNLLGLGYWITERN